VCAVGGERVAGAPRASLSPPRCAEAPVVRPEVGRPGVRRRHCATGAAPLAAPHSSRHRPIRIVGAGSSEPIERGQLIGASSPAGHRMSDARSRAVSQSALPRWAEKSITVGQNRTGPIESVGASRSLPSRIVLRHGVEPVVRGQACGPSAMNTPRDCTLNVGRLRTALVAPWRSPFTGRRSGPQSTIALR
jgi:hypothetical protein